MLQIVIYKKLNFWEEYTPLNQHNLISRRKTEVLGKICYNTYRT